VINQRGHSGRRDEAEPGVVKAFESGGASVTKLSGKDIPDLLVGFLRETHLVEVKTNRAKLRDGQAEFARMWLGSPVVVARTPAQARKWLAIWRERPREPGGGTWQIPEDVDRERLERLRSPKNEDAPP
jgi:Holliday junction resolvase